MRWLSWLVLVLLVFSACKKRQLPGYRRGPSSGAGSSIGAIEIVSEYGTVAGWAIDPKRPKESAEVVFYVDDEKSDPIGRVVADEDGDDKNKFGKHAFTFELPLEYRDRKERQIFAKVVSGESQLMLDNSPQAFSAIGPSAEGRAYFEEHMQPVLKACEPCHQFSYEKAWGSLAFPLPERGGSAENNEFLKRPAAIVRHGGGRLCDALDKSPCKEIKEWWQKEFGP